MCTWWVVEWEDREIASVCIHVTRASTHTKQNGACLEVQRTKPERRAADDAGDKTTWEDSSTRSTRSIFTVSELGLYAQGLPWQSLCALGCQRLGDVTVA